MTSFRGTVSNLKCQDVGSHIIVERLDHAWLPVNVCRKQRSIAAERKRPTDQVSIGMDAMPVRVRNIPLSCIRDMG